MNVIFTGVRMITIELSTGKIIQITFEELAEMFEKLGVIYKGGTVPYFYIQGRPVIPRAYYGAGAVNT